MSIKSEESTAQTVNEECNISAESCDHAIVYTSIQTFNSFEVEGTIPERILLSQYVV